MDQRAACLSRGPTLHRRKTPPHWPHGPRTDGLCPGATPVSAALSCAVLVQSNKQTNPSQILVPVKNDNSAGIWRSLESGACFLEFEWLPCPIISR